MVTSKTHAQAPARSLDPRMEALQRANDIRVRRAQLKKDLKDGRVQIESILLDPPEYVSTAKVFDMLMAVPKFGRVKAARLLNQCRISQSKTVGGLSERQRAELVAAARGATSKTLYAKLSPAQWDIAESARAVVAAGADGLSLVNTLRGLALDPVTLRPRLARGPGGYSGPGLRPVALACVHACAEAVDVPIVGMGGVFSGRDAIELAAVGASAVALGTVLFADPLAPARIRAEMVPEVAALGSEGLPANRARLLSI